MKVNTTRFGIIEIDDEALISMPDGMVGFEQYKSYCLIDHQPESVFKWLQCVHDPDVAFLVMDPCDAVGSYEFDLPDWDVEFLGLGDATEAALIATVTIDADAGMVTTNLLAPVVINSRTRLARQIVLDDERYAIKHQVCPFAATADPARVLRKAA